jgi:protein involved in polysaccharide export with SLBB domain
VIFVPPVGVTVALSGEVRRPAIYELKGEGTAEELLRLGGGFTPEADPALARLERIDAPRERVMMDIDLTSAQGRGVRLQSGDLLRIERVRSTYANSIQIEGHVLRPAAVQYRSGIRLTDVIPSIADLRPNADQRYVLIRREQVGTRRTEVLSADLAAAWLAPQSDASPAFLVSVYGPSLQDVAVPAHAPPLFVAVGATHFNVTNGCLALFAAWKAAGKPAEIHVYDGISAGFGMTKRGHPVDGWTDRLHEWLVARELTRQN